MYRIITISILLITLSFSSMAQGKGLGPHHRREMFEAEKVSYITQQLQLTPQEAQKFWPLYNQMQNEIEKLQIKKRELMIQANDAQNSLDDKKISTLSDQIIDLQIEIAQLQKKYHYQFKKVISAKKVLQLYRAERKFQGILLRRIKDNARKQKRRG